jgi:hypothetical protein
VSTSAWETLSNLMVHGVIGVDLLIGVMVATAVGVFLVWLGVLIFKGFKYFSGHGPGLTADRADQTSALLNQFDEMARITISRRARTRKRRHRPQPQALVVARRT